MSGKGISLILLSLSGILSRNMSPCNIDEHSSFLTSFLRYLDATSTGLFSLKAKASASYANSS